MSEELPETITTMNKKGISVPICLIQKSILFNKNRKFLKYAIVCFLLFPMNKQNYPIRQDVSRRNNESFRGYG